MEGVIVAAIGAVLLRLMVGLHGYSGEGVAPRYGDYEAQRHWMEITLALPPREWYRNSSRNDLTYWGLDYPPLSGWHALLMGSAFQEIEPESVELIESHGYESASSRAYMRWSVIFSDIMVYFPAALVAARIVSKLAFEEGFLVQGEKKAAFGQQGIALPDVTFWMLVVILFNPALIIIDHGHFQYNSVSLGLTLAAIAGICTNRDLTGAALYTLAFNHKHMALYFAPAFFGHLLGKCLIHERKLGAKILKIFKLGAVVLATMAIVWLPWLRIYEEDKGNEIAAVIGRLGGVASRMFPFQRGIFEDYVGNFWCASNFFLKWKRFKEIPIPLLNKVVTMPLLSLATTVLCTFPAMFHQILRPSKKGFLLSLTASSLAFFLFSFQVHEKSILLPLLPTTLLFPTHPSLALWAISISCYSMIPLLEKDKLLLALVPLVMLFGTLWSSLPRIFWRRNQSRQLCIALSHFLMLGTVLLRYLYPNPLPHLPFLHDLINSVTSFGHFFIAFLAVNMYMLRLPYQRTFSPPGGNKIKRG